MTARHVAGDVALVSLSALLLVLAFPTAGIELLAWVALVPLFIALRGKGPLSAAALSLVFGTAFSMAACTWFLAADGFEVRDLFLFGLALGLSFALFGLLFGIVSRKKTVEPLAAAPFLWVSMEYLRVHAGLLGFPGLLAGHSQHTVLPAIQVASVTGAYGVSFLVVAVNALLAEVLFRLRRPLSPAPSGRPPGLVPARGAAAVLCLLLLALGYGYAVLALGGAGREIPVTVIQGNIPQDIRWDPEMRERHLEKHVELTKAAAKKARAVLIVWPETTVQGSLEHDPVLNGTMAGLAREVETPLLVGSSEAAKFGPAKLNYPNRYNSAFLIDGAGEIVGQYRKIRLFPFGEYLPYQGTFPWPMRYLRTANYLAGREHTILDLGGVRFGAVICWESMFPALFREFARRGTDFMVNITNEAWFGATAAPYYFLAVNVFRSVEHRLPLIRASNTGVSCFIDPFGRITSRVEDGGKDIFVEGYRTEKISLRGGTTFYTRYGDLFAFLCLTVAVILIGASLLPRRS